MLGRMRLDGLNETKLPFAERAVALWRRGAPMPDTEIHLLIDVIKVRSLLSSPPTHCETSSAFSHLLRDARTLCSTPSQPG